MLSIINSTPLDHGAVLRLAPGLRCPHCNRLVRGCDIEPLNPGHRVVCAACHRDIISFEVAR
jgi:hypothetical protein